MARALAAALLTVCCAGCGPSEECRAYVACQRAVDDSVDVSAYDEGGRCWTLPRTAQQCTAVCSFALAALRELPDLPPVCAEDEAAAGRRSR